MVDKINVYSMKGVKKSMLSVDWFIRDKGEEALHLTITAYLGSARAGTACAKTRNEVNATGRKPWKQKGTGRARVGTASSPIWRGGGVTFPPKPRNFSKKVNKKVKQLALRRAITKQFDEGNLILVEKIEFPTIKTKSAFDFLKKLKAENRAIIVVDYYSEDEKFNRVKRSFSNLPSTLLVDSNEFNAYDALLGKKLIFTQKAFKLVAKRLNFTISEDEEKEPIQKEKVTENYEENDA